MTDKPSHDLWQELLTTALVGTGRRPVALPPAGSPLGDLLALIEGREPEAALLGAAAALSLYRRAGQVPPVESGPLPEPCEPEEQPPCRPRAGQHLALMLRGEHAAALPEWLAAVQAAGQRVPEERLPELLDLGRRKPELRELILPVLGRRGEWLIRQNPDWEHVAAAYQHEDATWETGSPGKRLAYLRWFRRQDPARARERLIETWEQESPKDRAEFLEVLGDGLSAEDEPFLEKALDDRRKEVRRAAAELLARLPQSQLRQRVIDRLRPLLNLKRGLMGAPRLEITLPEACDASMIRDGIEPKPSIPSMGEKAWWLTEMLSILPPGHWCELWGQKPAELIQAASKNEWKDALILGWSNATNRHADPDWAEVLIRWCYVREGKLNLPHASLPLRHVPPERMEVLVHQTLEADREPLYDGHPALWLVSSLSGPWSPSLSRTVIESIRQRILRGAGRSQPIWDVRSSLPSFAARIPPALADELSRGWPTDAAEWNAWAEPVDRFLSLLQFRHEMLVALHDR